MGTPYQSSQSKQKFLDAIQEQKNTAERINTMFKEDIQRQTNLSELSTIKYSQIITNLEKAEQQPSDKYICASLLQSIIDAGRYHAMIEKEQRSMTDAYYHFDKSKIYDEEKIAILPLSSMNRGGSFFFATQKNQSRETLQQRLHRLQKNGYPQATFLYRPRKDGEQQE